MADSSRDLEDLKQDVQKLLSEQRENVEGAYPADFLYYPIKNDDGTPLIVKVDDDYFAAWMSRDDVGEPFTKISLLTENQLNQIYTEIPAGASGKINTGPSIYVNPDLGDNDPDREVAADNVTRVSFNIESGEIVSAEQISANNSVSRRTRSRRGAEETPATATYGSALLPNDVIKDRNVSAEDLKQQLSGYQLISHIDGADAEENNKRAGTRLLISEISGSTQRLLAVQGGALEPGMEIDNSGNALAAAGNIIVETRLIPQQSVAPSVAVAPVDLGFEAKMQGVIDSGAGQADPNSPFRANEIAMLAGGFDDIAKNLAKGTLAGDSTAMDNVNSLAILFPEHRDIIASYALAEEKNAGTDPKTYLDQVSQRNPATPAVAPSALVSSGAEASSELQSLLDVVGVNVEKGERVSQINRDVGQVHRYLDSISGDKSLFETESASVVDYLNANRLSDHAQIISGYADDPSTYRDARSALREVSAISAPALTPQQEADNRAWEKTAEDGDPDVSVSSAQAAAEISARLKEAGVPASSETSVEAIRERLLNAAATVKEASQGDTPLDALLNKIGQDVQNKASASQVNRDVGQVLRYLNTISAVGSELLQSESARAVDYLNDKGLTKHANIISDFANDPSTFRDARSAIREVAALNVNSSAFDGIASNADNVNAQIEEFKAELAGVDGMDLVKDDASPDVSLASMKA